PESGVTPVYTISLPDVPDGGTLGSAPLIIIKSILQDGGLFRDQLQTLLIIHTQPERTAPGEDSAMLHFAVKYNVYPLPVQICLILCNGELDIDIQPPTGGSSIITLPVIYGFPFTVMGLQDFHDLIVVRNGPKPAIQAGKKQHINLIPPDGIQHFLELSTLVQLFPGRFCGINIDADNNPATFFCIGLQAFPLRLQG